MHIPQRESPAVSIIMPAYNAESYVAEAIESALRQSFGNFELLVVDDGSTDATAALVELYARRDTRISLIRQSNHGISCARNAAVARARGQFLALLDSDDVWLPTYLSEQLEILNAHPEITVLSGNAFNLGGRFDGQTVLPIADGNIRRLSLKQIIETEDSVCILSIFRREVVDTVGVFDGAFRRSEDYDFWLRTALAGFAIAVNPKPLARYRRRPDSLSADETRMLEAMRKPLLKIRAQCPDRADIQLAIDLQLERLLQRSLVAGAKTALLEGDMGALAQRFSALAERTGDVRYRVARWLAERAPVTIRWAYWCKRTYAQLSGFRRRADARPIVHREV